jgi:mRNA guanylyltransferase
MKRTKEQYDDRIIEARWDFEQQAWRFMRIRDDKRDANHISVVENIIKTIIEPVHQKDVCASLSFLFVSPSVAPPPSDVDLT